MQCGFRIDLYPDHGPAGADRYDGMTCIYWGDLDKDGKLLVDTWYLGLMAINEQYNCITLTVDPQGSFSLPNP